MTRRVFSHGPVPRYAQLADVIRQRIHRGVWPSGTRIPSIEALMQEFDVARVTVRQAIQLLAREGLLSPERGRGTFVTEEAARDRRLVVHTTLEKLVSMYRGDRPTLANIAETEEFPPLTEEDGIAAASYTHMRRIHSREGERYCLASIYIATDVFERAPDKLRSEVVLPILTSLEGVTIVDGHQSMRITTADTSLATDLHIPLNAPVAEVRRLLRGPDGVVIYFCEAIYRGDYVRLEMDLTA